MILGWYTRFDLYGALIGGHRSTLPVPWIKCPHDYNLQQVRQLSMIKDPDETTYYRSKIQKVVTELRCVSYELANVTSDITKQRISFEQFVEEQKGIQEKLDAWINNMDPALLDPRFAVTDFTGAPPRDKDDIVDPYEPGLLLRGELWPMNILRQDHLGVVIMLKYLLFTFAKARGHDDGKDGSELHRELQKMSYLTLQMFEAIELWPGSPKGGIIAGQACLGIAPMMLPKDEKHEKWFRKKMAIVERNG